MPIELQAPSMSPLEALDRVLDKGIVIDAWVHVSLVGIGRLTVQARIIVASIHTYLQYSDALAHAALSTPAAARPAPRADHLVCPPLKRETSWRMDGLPLPLLWSFA
jgi:hypothetical protein